MTAATACPTCGNPMELVTVHHKTGRVTRWHACPACHIARSADQPAPAVHGTPNLRLVRT